MQSVAVRHRSRIDTRNATAILSNTPYLQCVAVRCSLNTTNSKSVLYKPHELDYLFFDSAVCDEFKNQNFHIHIPRGPDTAFI